MEPPNPAASGKVIASPASAITSHTINLGTDGDASYDQTIKMKVPGTGMTVFNRYKLERILGRGGMGVVWLADDLKLERPVALKFLPSLIGLDPAAVKELKTETRRGLELSHPHIVRIYDFVDDEDAAAISMEFVDGKTLSELRMATDHGVFSVAQVSRWLPGICDALDYAHFQRKVVHRDLKPANIMLTTKEEVAKVADFGIARSLSDTMSRLSAAHIGTSGTLPYMSPQQAMGDRPLPTDDVYSLGATIYELLSGKPPFYRGDLPTQINSKIAPLIIERRQELEIKAADAIPKEWEDAISACLNKDPNLRPSCAGMLAEMLGLKPSSGTARTVSFPKTSSAGKPSGSVPAKSKTPILAAAAVVAVVAGGAIWHFAGHKSTPPALSHGDTSVKAVDESPPKLGPKTPVVADAIPPRAPLPTTPPEGGSKAGSPAPTPGPTATPPASPSAPVTASAAPVSAPPMVAANPAASAPTVDGTPAVPPAPAGSPAPAPATVAQAAPSGTAMPLTPDSASSIIAASTPPAPQPSATVPPGSGSSNGGPAQTVLMPPAPAPLGGAAPAPNVPVPMPPQPIVSDPPSGFWTVEQIYPTPPYATYSPVGKKYLLYRTQAALKERGLYTSSVDGKEGKGTHNAIQLFQAKSGLRPTGLLDVPTLAALNLSAEPDKSDWTPPSSEGSASGARRAPGGGRYGRQSSSDDEPGFFERTGGKLKNLFK